MKMIKRLEHLSCVWENWESWDSLAWRRKGSSNLNVYKEEVQRQWSHVLFSGSSLVTEAKQKIMS